MQSSQAKSILPLFAGVTIVSALLFFKFDKSLLSKIVLNAATAAQLINLISFIFFEKLTYAIPNWMHKDETTAVVLFLVMFIFDSNRSKSMKFLIHDVSVATSRALTVTLFGIEHIEVSSYVFIFIFPLLASLFLLLFVLDATYGLPVFFLNAVLSIGLAVFLTKVWPD